MTGSSPATTAGEPLVLDADGRARQRAWQPGVEARVVGEATLPDGRRAVPGVPADRRALSRPAIRAGGGRRDLRHPGRRRSGASPPRSPASPSRRRSSSPCRGPTGPGGGTRRCAAGRSRCMRCAASRPIPTGSRPAARCICCRCCSARSMCRAAGATSRRIRSRARRGRSRPASRARSPPASRWPGAPLGYPLAPEDLILDADGTAAPHRQGVLLGGADRRARHDAHGDHATPGRATRTRSTRSSCTWPTWRGTRR